MRNDRHKGDSERPKLQWTADDRARHQAVRDMFRNWHPSPEELIASGEGANFDLHGECRELRPFVEDSCWPAKRRDSRWPRYLGAVESTSQPFLVWKTGTTRTRRSTRALCGGGRAVLRADHRKRSATRDQQRRRSRSERRNTLNDLRMVPTRQRADPPRAAYTSASPPGVLSHIRARPFGNRCREN